MLPSAASNGLSWPMIEHMRVFVCTYTFPIRFGSSCSAPHSGADRRLMELNHDPSLCHGASSGLCKYCQLWGAIAFDEGLRPQSPYECKKTVVSLSLPRTSGRGEFQPPTSIFNNSLDKAAPNAIGFQPNEPVRTEYGRAMPSSNQHDDRGLSKDTYSSAPRL